MANISFFNALQYHILYNKGINLYGGTAMKTIHIEFSDERLITPSGLVFVGQILGKSNFVKKINRAPISNEYLQKQIKNGDILLTYIGMLCQGKPQYEAVREMMDDPGYYKYALGIALCDSIRRNPPPAFRYDWRFPAWRYPSGKYRHAA